MGKKIGIFEIILILVIISKFSYLFVAFIITVPFIFIYQLVKKWERK
jgi:hypothetical protein